MNNKLEFYNQEIASVVEYLGTNLSTGLDDDKSAIIRKKFGANKLKSTHSRNPISIFIAQFTSPLVLMLMTASGISFYLGQPRDASILMMIVIANSIIGFYQEWKSENILASLQKLVVNKCTVVRNRKLVEIFSADLVPGDIVVLYEGDSVPADLRLFETNDFSANEFILTGESLPANKITDLISGNTLLLAEIKNCAFMGTSVARGDAKGIVYATGMNSVIGKISSAAESIKTTKAPVQTEIADVAKKILYATMVIGLCLFLTRIILHDSIGMALTFAVGVAAAMVPEGLPAQISVALALAVGRLAKKKAVVKQIAAAQTLGSATVIATDKTGTITKNEMTITGCYFNGMSFSVSGLGYEPLGEIIDESGVVIKKNSLGDLKVFFLSGFLSSSGRINSPDTYHNTWYCIGDPTEASFSTLTMKAGFKLEEIEKDYPIIKSFGFSSFNRKAAVIRSHKGKIISFVKGSLESILLSSKHYILKGEIQLLSEEIRKQILATSAAFAGNALRIIAIAYRDLELKTDYSIENAEEDLIFAGFVTMLDPPHEEVQEAISTVFKAHMKVFMITGDNEVTAKAIANKIGLMNENNEFPEVINGSSLKSMSDAEVCANFNRRALIYSRVSPEDKYRIVDLLKNQGEIVAVTGDGVNDTLSLKRADIGVAMGLNGSKVAQEAANMILLDDNFSTIVLAVKEGRTIFRNLEKTILTNLSCNIAELACVLCGFAGAFMGLESPIFVVQILLIDMVGELPPLSMLTFDPSENRIMELPPRNPKDKILTNVSMKEILFSGAIMGLTAYVAFLVEYFFNSHPLHHYEKSVTVTFVSIIFGQFANILSSRTYGSVFSAYLFSNKKLLFAFGSSLVMILLIIYVPLFNTYFHTSPLLPFDWIFPIASGLICLFFYEFRKYRKTK